MTTLEEVRAKIIGAVPDIAEESICTCKECVEKSTTRSITLADVLRAIPEGFAVDSQGFFCEGDYGGYVPNGTKWNLALSLDEQEPEVVEFVGKVLGVLWGK